MKRCPFCAEEIRAAAIKCRHCGEFLDGRPRREASAMGAWSYEYRSAAEIFGLPVLHVAKGIDPETGRPRVARGIIAVGNLAIGVFAFGGVALGGFTFGGFSLGLLVAFGGVAIGGVALGGVALGAYLALGGLAISAQYALGGLAIAPHALGGNVQDPELRRLLEGWWRSPG